MSPPNIDTLLIFLQDNIPREALQIVARGHHKRTGRSLTAVQGRLRSSPLPLKVPPSDPPPLSPSPLFNRTESNEKTRGFHAILPCYFGSRSLSVIPCPIEGRESRKRGHGGETKRGKGDVSPLDDHSLPFCGVSPEQYYLAFPFRRLNNRRNRCLSAILTNIDTYLIFAGGETIP